jgi:putative colanic acid biosynthesis acetyltransferase WcaB
MSSVFKFITQDWDANSSNTKGKIFGLFFRISNIQSEKFLVRLLLLPLRIFYKTLFEWVIGIEIPYRVRIGRSLKVYHFPGIVIHRNVIIGENCTLRQSTTIGNKTDNSPCPVIGDNVNIGAHVCIIGDIVIGDNVTIGAGSVVIKNIPSNSVVVGNPAKIVKTISAPEQDLILVSSI